MIFHARNHAQLCGCTQTIENGRMDEKSRENLTNVIANNLFY
jgi:hypothetical protein